jgi:VIT1/CCC1 family predicted Fe2+/Mn2+ transporter
MAAGAYVGGNSERELQQIQRGKAEFLGGKTVAASEDARPVRDAVLVGGSYFLGAVIPALPMALGAKTLWASLIVAGAAILLVSTVLAFLSGIEIRKRAWTNLFIILAAVGVSYAIGLFADKVWGLAL